MQAICKKSVQRQTHTFPVIRSLYVRDTYASWLSLLESGSAILAVEIRDPYKSEHGVDHSVIPVSYNSFAMLPSRQIYDGTELATLECDLAQCCSGAQEGRNTWQAKQYKESQSFLKRSLTNCAH